jgi:hypothetical protein
MAYRIALRARKAQHYLENIQHEDEAGDPHDHKGPYGMIYVTHRYFSGNNALGPEKSHPARRADEDHPGIHNEHYLEP